MRFDRRFMGALAFAASLSPVLCSDAEAVQYEFSVHQADGRWECTQPTRRDEGQGLTVLVEIVGATEVQEAAFALGPVEGDGEIGMLAQPDPQGRLWEIQVAEVLPEDTTLEVRGEIDGQEVRCPSFRLSLPGTEAEGRPTREAPDLSGWDPGAWTHLKDAGVEDLEALREALDELRVALDMDEQDSRFLLHLPSGLPAAPFPESVAESDELQVVVILPENGAVPYEVVVKSCPDTNPFRIEGKIEDVGEFEAAALPDFALYPVGKPFRCGTGNLLYQVKPLEAAGGPETELRVRPVYHLATTFAWGFDFTEERSFSVRDEKIVETVDQAGTGLRVGFTWFPWGVDYEEMRWWNYFINPTAVFEPSDPGKSFVVGTTITPKGGVSILVGASIHKVTELDGFEVGDDFTGDGDVPTRTDWSSDGVDWFVGISMDTKVFTALKDIWKIGK